MKPQSYPLVEVPSGLLDAIRSFPARREVEHCGHSLPVSPFDHYARCPHCGSRLKLRSFSGVPELEDLFDAVFEWMGQPETRDVAQRRQEEIEADKDE